MIWGTAADHSPVVGGWQTAVIGGKSESNTLRPMTGLRCGFNRWMQRIGEIVQRVFRSLVFSLGAHSISALRH
jgi:hypothetical protein